MERRRLAALALALWGALTHAGINTWTPVEIPGGSIQDVVHGVAPGIAFAVTSAGVYRSRDDGASWALVKSDFPVGSLRSLAIDPSDASRVYLVSSSWPSLYMSMDGGATFNPLPALPTAVIGAMQVAVSDDGRTLYINSQARIFRSTDRGGSWVEVSPFSSGIAAFVYVLRQEPGDPQTLYAAGTLDSTQVATKRSRDGGQTWTTLYAGTNSTAYTHDLAVSRANPAHLWAARSDGVFRSTDRGLNWTAVRTGDALTHVTTDPADPSIAVAASPYGRVLRTSDAGASWQDIGIGQRAGSLYALSVDPASSARILVGGRAGLWGTVNSGASWTARNTGIQASIVDEISADASTGRIYFNVESDGIFQMSGSGLPQPLDNVELGSLQPGSQYVISMLAQPGRILASLTAGLARSTDGGNSWTLQTVAPFGTSQQMFDIESSTSQPLTILAAGSRGIYRSTDGGQLWTVAGAGLPVGADMGRMRVAPSDGRVAYASLYMTSPGGPSTNLGIFRSDDSGISWAQASGDPDALPLRLLAVDPTAPKTIYAVSDTQLRRSTDGGLTWSNLIWSIAANAGQPWTMAIDPRDPRVLYAASFTRIARSVDAGTTWETLRAGTEMPLFQPQQLFVDPFRPATVLLSTFGQGVQSLDVSPNLVLTANTPPAPAGVGVPLVHSFLLRNLGPFDATSVTLTLRWPAAAQAVAITNSAGTCVKSGRTALCTVPVLHSGDAVTIALTATAASTGEFEVEGSVAAAEPDAAAGDNAIALITTINARADVAVSMTGTASALPGSTASYAFTVRNNGPEVATSPTLVVQVAAGLTPSSVTSTAGSCTSSPPGRISCALGDLAVGVSATVNVSVATTSVGNYVSTAQLTTATYDPSGTDNTSSLTTSVTAPASPPPPASGGGEGGGGAISTGQLIGLAFLTMLLGLRRRRSTAIPGQQGLT